MGLEGDDTLDGGAGTAADILIGGSGNDIYKIRHVSDAIQEGAGDLFDVAEVYLQEEYRLKSDAQVETLKAGDGFNKGVHLVGNAYSVNILGSGAIKVSDTLDGGTGVDIAHALNGGDGNDTYYIVNVNDEIEGERDLENPNDDGKLNGDKDVAYLYSGLYATKEELQAKIDHYMAIGIEEVHVIDGVPEAPDNTAPTNVRLSNDTFLTSVDENSTQDTKVGFVVADDDTVGMTFEIYGNDAFGIRQDTGEIYVLDPAKLDREQVASYTVHVRAKDAGGLYSAWRDITITLNDVNEAADSISFNGVKNIHVGDTNNAPVVTALAHDPDVNTDTFQTNLYRFQNGQGPDGTTSADGLFKIDKDTGQVSLADGVTLTEADKKMHTLWVIAYDKDHADIVSQAFSFDVVVLDATGNTPPNDVQLSTGGLSITVDENTPDSAFDYSIVAQDDKAGLTYYVEDNAYVTVDETTGRIHLKDTFKLDYEAITDATFTFNVYAKDSEGAVSDTQTITVTLNDKNDGPESVSVADKAAIKVGDVSGIVAATASVVDKDTKEENRQNHYQFVGNDGWTGTTTQDGLFTIDQNGQITTARDVQATDYFAHNLKVQAYDEDGNVVETTYTVDVGAAGNTAPTSIEITSNWAREWARDGFVIGSFLPVDPDGPSGSYTFKFWLGDDDSGNPILSDFDADHRFTVDGDRLIIADGTKLDFEVARSHKFWIHVSDGSNTYKQEIAITVRDWLNENGTGRDDPETFKGGAGDDIFDGSGGDDILIGGFGSDDLTGGAGHDAFVFDKDLINDEFDTIRDFNVGEDKIRLKGEIFQLDDLVDGELNDDVFGIGHAATTETQRVIYDVDNGALYYDEDGSGDAAAMLIAIFDPEHKPLLTKSDFLVI
ncbi:hypothetical protein C4E04_04690 [Microvirga sp. 17 mud 1-3]|nr:hypothetical protein C4E04_04690 [Microvirga sp. 17 mud 1-3]